MLNRFITLLLCLVVGGVVGAWVGNYFSTLSPSSPASTALIAFIGASAGMLLAAILWFFADTYQTQKLLLWLMRPRRRTMPRLWGVWREIAHRVLKEIKAQEAKKREHQARLNDFLGGLQNSPNGVITLNKDGCIEWCNHTAAEHFGIDLSKDYLQNILHLVRSPDFVTYFQQADYSQEVLVPGRNSSLSRPVNLQIQLHPYGKGRKLLLSRDVTALEQAQAMRRDFVANVSHEIRTPLTVISGVVQTLQHLPLNPQEQKHYLNMLEQQTQRMQNLVQDFLALSKLEANPHPVFNQWHTVTDLLEHIFLDAQALQKHLPQKNQQLMTLHLPEQLYEINAAYEELYSAMLNLVNNAIQHTPNGSKIRIEWQLLSSGAHCFSVLDDGPGIPHEHLPRLTERFYRVDPSRSRDTGGTGLGLAIVKHIAQRHQAELRIESSPNKGSRFSLIFPAQYVRALLMITDQSA